MKKYFALLLLASLMFAWPAAEALAQGQLRVRVVLTDAETNEPIEGAQVVAYQPERPNNRFNDVSDESGSVVVAGMIPGRVIFEIVADGYQKGRFQQRLPSNRPRIEFEIELAPIKRAEGEATPEIVQAFETGARLSKEGKHEEALAVFEPLLEEYPDIRELYIAAATEHVALGQPKEAAELLKAVLELEPDNTEYMLRLASALAAAGETEAANEWYLKVIENNPDDLYAIEQVAYANYEAGNFDAARKYYTRALELNPDNPIANYYLANICYVQDDFEIALKHYKKYIELDPNNQTGGVEAAKATMKDIEMRMEAEEK